MRSLFSLPRRLCIYAVALAASYLVSLLNWNDRSLRERLSLLDQVLARLVAGTETVSSDPDPRLTDDLDAVLGGNWLFVEKRCLPLAVTRYLFLRRGGAAIELVFGVSWKPDGVLRAHCWLETKEGPVCEKEDPRHRYEPLYRMSHGALLHEGGAQRRGDVVGEARGASDVTRDARAR